LTTSIKDQKIKKLKKILTRLQTVLIAYSGGLDSTFLLKVAVDTLGRDNVLAVTARSETYPRRELHEAARMAKVIGARHTVIRTSELALRDFKENPVNRCYYCKRELFLKLKKTAQEKKLSYCLDATNYDDLKDVRYGRRAARELGIKSPLLEAKLTKDDIRSLSKALRLMTWDKPPLACLASRIPYGSPITRGKLSVVEKAEEYLRGFGIRQVRVRHHDKLARIEVPREDIPALIDPRHAARIARRLKRLGFAYIAVDLQGYRAGSMNPGRKPGRPVFH